MEQEYWRANASSRREGSSQLWVGDAGWLRAPQRGGPDLPGLLGGDPSDHWQQSRRQRRWWEAQSFQGHHVREQQEEGWDIGSVCCSETAWVQSSLRFWSLNSKWASSVHASRGCPPFRAEHAEPIYSGGKPRAWSWSCLSCSGADGRSLWSARRLCGWREPFLCRDGSGRSIRIRWRRWGGSLGWAREHVPLWGPDPWGVCGAGSSQADLEGE